MNKEQVKEIIKGLKEVDENLAIYNKFEENEIYIETILDVLLLNYRKDKEIKLVPISELDITEDKIIKSLFYYGVINDDGEIAIETKYDDIEFTVIEYRENELFINNEFINLLSLSQSIIDSENELSNKTKEENVYFPKLKLIAEYDEPYHESKKQMKKDRNVKRN